MRKFVRTSLWYALGTTVSAFPLAVVAQGHVRPDAGQTLESLQQSRPVLPPAPPAISLTLPDDSASVGADEGPPIDVQGFVVEGNTAIATSELQELLQPLAGQTATLSQLQAGAARITRLYRERGYPFAQAYLPAQTVDAGVVQVRVLEGRLGAVRIDNRSRQQALVVEQPLARLQPGDLLRGDALETSLLLLGEASGLRAQATLQPGAETGTADLVVTAQDTPLASGVLGVDNHGNHHTGPLRASGSVQLYGALGLGEQIQLQGVLSNKDLRNYRLGYQMPVGPWSTRVGASAAHLTYALGHEFEALDVSGNAQVGSVFVIQPLVRQRRLNLNAKLQYEQKRLTDNIGQQDIHDKKRSNVTTLGLDGNWQDNLGGGAVSQWALGWGNGRLRLGSDAQQRDSQTVRSAGSFQVLTADIARWQSLGGPWSLHGHLHGQWANKNLDSSEKMSLGGAYGVRAYPQGEASGDHGLLGSLELRYALDNDWQLSGFVDTGRVRFQHRPWSPGENGRSLSGAGVGLQRNGTDWSLETALAWKVSGSHATSVPDRSPRLWVKAQKYF